MTGSDLSERKTQDRLGDILYLLQAKVIEISRKFVVARLVEGGRVIKTTLKEIEKALDKTQSV